MLTVPALTLQPGPLPLIPASLPVGLCDTPAWLSKRSSLTYPNRAHSPLPSPQANLSQEDGHSFFSWPGSSPWRSQSSLKPPYQSSKSVSPTSRCIQSSPSWQHLHCCYPRPSRLLPGSCNSCPACLWLLIFAHSGLFSCNSQCPYRKQSHILAVLCSKPFPCWSQSYSSR